MLTTELFNQMAEDDRWLGFGYLGERANFLEGNGDVEVVTDADEKAIAEANVMGLDEDELFEWANSKNGRWYGDCMFGGNGRDAERYLPGQPQH